MTETATLEAQLRRFSAFHSLEVEWLSWLAARVRLFQAPVGHEVFGRRQLPELCYAIVEGRGRLLHDDPAVRRPLTLALCQPGDLVGWAGLTRGRACEWLTAASSLKLIGFSADDFQVLAHESEAFSAWLDRSSSPAEFMDVLEPALRRRPTGDPDEREVLRRLLGGMTIVPSRELRQLPDQELWLWNAVPDHPLAEGIVVGEPVNPALLAQLPPGFPLRLVRIQRQLWEDTLAPRLELELDPEVLQPLLPSAATANRYADVALAPDPQGGVQVSSDHRSADLPSRVPVVTGVGPQGQTMACLEMLALHYGIPFRRDVVEKAVRDQIRDRPASLYNVGNLATLLNLQGSLSDVAEVQLSRVPTPFVSLIYGQPGIVHQVKGSLVNAVVPEYGRLSIPLDDLTQGQGGASVLMLSPGRDAQRRKLSFRWFLPQIRRYRRSLGEVLVASLILQLLNLANPLILQQIFDRVIGQRNVDTLYTLGFLLLGVSLFQGLLGAVRTYQFADTTNRIDIALGGEVIQHLLRLPLRYFDKRPVGELQTRIAELANIRNFLTGNALTLFLDAVFSLIYIGVMLTYSGVLTVVALGVVPLFLGLTVVASPLIRSQLRRAAEQNASTQSLLVEALSGVQTIKAQNAENTVRWRWQRNYSAFMAESFRSLLIGVSAGTTGNFINQVSGLLTLWVGAFLVIKGDLTVGQLIAFRIISGYVIGPLINLATSWQSYQGVALSMERLSDVLDSTPEGSGVDAQQLPLPPIAGDVTFQSIDFSFNEGAALVASNVSFHIPAGYFVGIVGRSGSGKSTIMKLLPRLYEPISGRILIDGFDISKLQIGSVRSQIGIVPQDSLLFDGTVRDNITLTCPEATTEEIIHAARVACAHDFIMELPDGYSSRVGERGAGLSGGQRQRIAIARAVLQRPKLLILDEATSALDYITERQVCQNLKREFEGTTVFFITHRLSTIRTSDRILMMDSGSLVEEGTHQDLLEAKGRYFALYSQQESSLD